MNWKFDDNVNVRSGPSTQTKKVEQYHPGETVKLDQIHYTNNEKWGSYIGGSGQRRYVCLEKDGESYGHRY